jgi:hypothetical protein
VYQSQINLFLGWQAATNKIKTSAVWGIVADDYAVETGLTMKRRIASHDIRARLAALMTRASAFSAQKYIGVKLEKEDEPVCFGHTIVEFLSSCWAFLESVKIDTTAEHMAR